MFGAVGALPNCMGAAEEGGVICFCQYVKLE